MENKQYKETQETPQGNTTTQERQTTKSIMKKDGNSGAVVSNTPEPELTRPPQVVFQGSAQEEGMSLQIQESEKGKQSIVSNTVSAATEALRSIIDADKNSKESIQLEREHPHFIVEDKLHTPTRQLSPQRSPHSDGDSNNNNNNNNPKQSLNINPQVVMPSPGMVSSTGETVTRDILVPKRENSKNTDIRLPTDDGKKHILIGCCGTPGVFKLKAMIKKIEDIYGKENVSIQVILTFSARRFFAKKLEQQITTSNKKTPVSCDIPVHIRVWNDLDEWDTWKQRNDPVLHIELRRWADILLIAPLTANTLAKISLGLCDNLLTCVVRAWNPTFPIFLAPSMISSVYNSVMTKKEVNVIKDEMPWITILKPSEKIVGMHGDIGLGGMMDINEIVDKVVLELGGYPQDDSDSEDKNDDETEDDDEGEDEDNKSVNEDDSEEEEDDDDDDDDDDETDDTKTL